MKSIEDFTGFSESKIYRVIQNALAKAENLIHFAVIELFGPPKMPPINIE